MSSKQLSHRLLLLVNIRQLLTLRSPSTSSGPRRATQLSELGIVNDGAVLCEAGKIVSVGKTRAAIGDTWIKANRKRVIEIDCANKVVLPGFVDSHTHPAFVSPRLIDFEKRIAGATYEKIAESGGGIRSSVKAVRDAAQSLLARKIAQMLDEMAANGTTTVEAKSGYGLTVDSELKSLAAIRKAARQWPGTVIPTLLGAHIIPEEFLHRREKYIDLICNQMIPQTAHRKLAEFVDVFIERGAFTLQESTRIFVAARAHSLQIRAHVSQLSRSALQSILKFNPVSLDHLDYISDDDILELTRTNTIATLVPGANHFLGVGKYPPARKLIEAGVPIALATDFNPGSSPTASMPFVMSLACTQMKMSPSEVITASTINGSWALQLQDRKGSIEPGKDADLAVFNVEDYREIPYWFAANKIAFTVLNGTVGGNPQV